MAAVTTFVHWDKTKKIVYALPSATAAPAGTEKIGEFTHPAASDKPDEFGVESSHVLYNHVRDFLNQIGKPATASAGWDWNKAVTNMQEVTILTEAPKTT